MRLLDLFCGAGGAAMGYYRAGFTDITGIDKHPMPRYPFKFIQADALEYLAEHGQEYDVIHASPPCQAYTKARWIRGNHHPDLIGDTRELLIRSGKLYIIENVPGSPLINPVMLNGMMFGLRTERKRLFECSFEIGFILLPPPHAKKAKMGRLAKPGELSIIAGKGGKRGVKQQWEEAMDINWMTTIELSQAIPPAYTEWIGRWLMEIINQKG